MHCSNARLAAARTEAWEGQDPRGIRVLLADRRGEKHFLKFLELSRAGRAIAGGTDVEEARVVRMDRWIVREVEECNDRHVSTGLYRTVG